MNDYDFANCKYIHENMRFITFNDFYLNRKAIKRMYDELDGNSKIFYKWYIYANIHMKETYKNGIWDFLNGYDDNGFNLLNLKLRYKSR